MHRKRRRLRKTLLEQRQDIIEAYREEHGHDALDPDVVAAWALKTGLADAPKPVEPAKALARDLRRALRQEYIEDPSSGRRVRRNHAARIPGQGVLWAEIGFASEEHMQLSAQQRRLGILRDCVQLDTDVEAWNDVYRRDGDSTIQMSFDFRNDLAELKESDEYPDAAPDAEFEDEE